MRSASAASRGARARAKEQVGDTAMGNQAAGRIHPESGDKVNVGNAFGPGRPRAWLFAKTFFSKNFADTGAGMQYGLSESIGNSGTAGRKITDPGPRRMIAAGKIQERRVPDFGMDFFHGLHLFRWISNGVCICSAISRSIFWWRLRTSISAFRLTR